MSSVFDNHEEISSLLKQPSPLAVEATVSLSPPCQTAKRGREITEEQFWQKRHESVGYFFLAVLSIGVFGSFLITGFVLIFCLLARTMPLWALVVSIGINGVGIHMVQWLKKTRKFPKFIRMRQLRGRQVPSWLARTSTYGVAGDLSSARGTFTDENIAKGEFGEAETAKLLDSLTDIPGVRIFHGLEWLDRADIDHLVLLDGRIAVIDSKNWSGVRHVMAQDGQVSSIQENGTKTERKISVHHAAKTIETQFPGMVVRAYLAVHGGGECISAHGTPVRMKSAEDAVDDVRRFLTTGGNVVGRVDVDRVKALSMMCKSSLSSGDVIDHE